MSISVQLKVNGKSVTLDCPSNTTLVDLIRERLELTGTHVGCDTPSVVLARCISTAGRLSLAQFLLRSARVPK